MAKGAENVVQNIGAIAETTSIFYNTIVKQVPKDVALILTQHFMDITIARRPAAVNAAAAAAAAARAAEQQRAQQRQQPRREPAPEAAQPTATMEKPEKQEKPEKPENPEKRPEALTEEQQAD